jgi:hypothetical protein
MTTTDCLIPAEWHPEINRQPDDFAMRSALADLLLESGDELAAECLRWSVEKRRTPNRKGCQWDFRGQEPEDIPEHLFWENPLIDEHKGYDFVGAFDRLIRKWKNSTPEEREAYWRWTP